MFQLLILGSCDHGETLLDIIYVGLDTNVRSSLSATIIMDHFGVQNALFTAFFIQFFSNSY